MRNFAFLFLLHGSVSMFCGCGSNSNIGDLDHSSAVDSILENDGFVYPTENGIYVRLQGSTIEINDNDIRNLGGLAGLNELDASRTSITSKGLTYLQSQTGLEVLHLDHCPLITDDAIPVIARLKSLKKVSLVDTGATEIGVNTLRELNPVVEVVSDEEKKSNGSDESKETGVVSGDLLDASDRSDGD